MKRLAHTLARTPKIFEAIYGMVYLESLTKNPNTEDIEDALLELDEKSLLMLDNVMIVVKYIIPVHPSLSESSQKTLFGLFSRSFKLLTHTLNFINLMKSSPEAKIYRQFLIEVLATEPSCLSNYILSSNSNLELKLIRSYFFGSKILNAVSDTIDIMEYLRLIKYQILFIMDHDDVSNARIYADLFSSLLSLHPVFARDLIFGDLIFSSPTLFSKFKCLFVSGSVSSQHRIADNLLLYFDKTTNKSNVNSAVYVMKQIDVSRVGQSVLLDLNNLYLKAAVIVCISKDSLIELYDTLIAYFSMQNHNFDDKTVCELLVIVLRELDSDQKRKLAHQSLFLDAVTSRLASEDLEVRERTMYIGKLITEGGLKYDSTFKIDVPKIKIPQDEPTDLKSLQVLSAELSESTSSESTSSEIFSTSISTLSLHDKREDHRRSIVFLKDLVKEFEDNEKGHQEQVHLLMDTVKLVRQKKDFAAEIKYYSSPLLTSVAHLSNNMDEDHFEEWKINALVSILSTVPEKVTDLIKILFMGDISLQQRMCILSALGLAARELRGLDDSVILKPQSDFPTKRLPWDKAAGAKTAKSDLIEQQAEDTYLNEGRVVWKSRKLNKSKRAPNENRFMKHAALFFFPLAHGWMNGIEMGTYDHLFKKHYLSTLRIIISAAFPHPEFNSMSDFMGKVAEDASKQGIEL